MKRTILICFVFAFLSCSAQNHNIKQHSEKNEEDYSNQFSLEKRVDSLLSLMTLEEKVGQMNQYSGFWDATGRCLKQVVQQQNMKI